MIPKLDGSGTDEGLADTLAAIEEGLADIEAGRTTPLDQVFRELDAKYGVSSHSLKPNESKEAE